MPATSKRNIKLTLLAHPFELALGAALAINGLAGLVGYPSPSVAALPLVVRLGYLAISLLGGIGVVGLILNDPPSHVGLGKSLERASLYLVAASYLALAVMLVGNNGVIGIPTALVALVVGGACILRAQAIRKAALIILEQIRAAASAQEDRRA